MAFLANDASAPPGWNSQSFPSIDPRIGWVLTMLLLVIALLLTLGVLRIQIGPLPGMTWLAVLFAQFVTAAAVAAATHLSARRRSGADRTELAEDSAAAPGP